MPIPLEGLNLAKVLGRGRVPEHNPFTHIISRVAESTGVAIGYGVMDGTDNEKQVKLFSSAAGVFRGVAGYSSEASDLDNGLFEEYDMVPVISQGPVTVYVEEAVAAGDPVRIRHTDGTPGAFCTTAVANKTALLTGCEFRSDSVSGSQSTLFLSPPFTVTADT